MKLETLIVIFLLIETIVQAVKPSDGKKFALAELISMGAGVLVAVIGKINLLEGLFIPESMILLYLLFIISGIVLGRGPSFVHDAWAKLRSFNKDAAGEAAGFVEKIVSIVRNIIGTPSGDRSSGDEEGSE